MSATDVSREQQTAARVAGFAYLLIIVTGVFAEFFVRSSLVVPGDAAATAANIAASESLFRAGFASDLLMLVFDVVVALALYVVLGPVSKGLALLAAFFRLVMDGILGLNLLNVFAALLFLGSAEYLAVFDAVERQALALAALDAHGMGYSIGLVPFGCATAVLGYLFYKSRYVPRALAVLLTLAALIYLTGSFLEVLAPRAAAAFEPAYLVPFVAELALALWLLVRGVDPRPALGR